MDIAFLLNGETVRLTSVDPTRSLLDWLREERGLTGTKEGCNEGDCGACSVLIATDAGLAARNACITLLGQVDGCGVTTVEGLSGPGGALHPVQQALIEHHGSQCGFCTPGIAVTLAAAHLEEAGGTGRATRTGAPRAAEGAKATGEAGTARTIDDRLAGNLCRCTGYAPIVRAAREAARRPVPAWFAPAPAALPESAGAHPESSDALARALMNRPHATLIAGNTDTGLWLTKGLRELDGAIFLGRVAQLRRHLVARDGIHIGAGVTIEALRGLLAEHYPRFAAMLARFASPQIRAGATLGGNIANGSPIADTPPPLIALEAKLWLRRGEARRVIALEDFFLEYGKQDLQPGEFIEGVSIPHQPDRLFVYKNSKRFDQDISAVLGAFYISLEDDFVHTARVAFGGMAGVPKRAPAVEEALEGRAWNAETCRLAGEALARDFTPLDDLRASAEYRLEVGRAMLLRCWLEDRGKPVSVREVSP